MLPLDRVVCLSLPRRTDRRDRLNRQWSEQVESGNVPNIQIEYFDAFSPDTCLVPGSWPHRPSYYATNLGHLRILENLWLDRNVNTALILEDDALFLPEFTLNILKFWGKLEKHAPDWLAVFLGGHFQREPTNVVHGLSLNKGSTQSHAYILNRQGIWRLYDHLWTCQFRIVDWAYSDMMGGDSCVYSPSPMCVSTAEGYSDNLLDWKRQGT